MTVHN